MDFAPRARTPLLKHRLFRRAPGADPIVVTGSSHEPGFSLPSVSARYYRYVKAQPSSYFPSCPFYIYIGVYGIVSRPCEFSLDTFIDKLLYSGRKTICTRDIDTRVNLNVFKRNIRVLFLSLIFLYQILMLK
jgi:hypothetical protein